MNFASFNAYPTSLSNSCYILKFVDIMNVEKFISINSCFNKYSLFNFNENFKLVSTTHSYNTKSGRNGLLFVQVRTQSDLEENQLSIQPLLHRIISEIT